MGIANFDEVETRLNGFAFVNHSILVYDNWLELLYYLPIIVMCSLSWVETTGDSITIGEIVDKPM